MAGDKVVEFGDGTAWFSVDSSDNVTIGLTDKALLVAGHPKDIDFPPVGEKYDIDQWIGCLVGREDEVEILSPFDLIVTEVNRTVSDDFDLLLEDPTGDAWLIRGEILKK